MSYFCNRIIKIISQLIFKNTVYYPNTLVAQNFRFDLRVIIFSPKKLITFSPFLFTSCSLKLFSNNDSAGVLFSSCNSFSTYTCTGLTSDLSQHCLHVRFQFRSLCPFGFRQLFCLTSFFLVSDEFIYFLLAPLRKCLFCFMSLFDNFSYIPSVEINTRCQNYLSAVNAVCPVSLTAVLNFSLDFLSSDFFWFFLLKVDSVIYFFLPTFSPAFSCRSWREKKLQNADIQFLVGRVLNFDWWNNLKKCNFLPM